MSADDFKRVFPPPRRRPGLLTILVRWRWEVLLGGVVAIVWWWVGGPILAVVVSTLLLLVVGVPAARRASASALKAVVVPHRVRSGLIQAGVTDRNGRPPWIVRARVHAETVFVHVWLRAGTTPADLHLAADVICAACGAARVEVTHNSARRDRAVVVVFRPRWGCVGR